MEGCSIVVLVVVVVCRDVNTGVTRGPPAAERVRKDRIKPVVVGRDMMVYRIVYSRHELVETKNPELPTQMRKPKAVSLRTSPIDKEYSVYPGGRKPQPRSLLERGTFREEGVYISGEVGTG